MKEVPGSECKSFQLKYLKWQFSEIHMERNTKIESKQLSFNKISCLGYKFEEFF